MTDMKMEDKFRQIGIKMEDKFKQIGRTWSSLTRNWRTEKLTAMQLQDMFQVAEYTIGLYLVDCGLSLLTRS